MAKKFNMADATGLKSPAFDESEVSKDDTEVVSFPYREILGALQWTVTVARPDVAQQVQFLARFSSKPPTRARVNAAKKIVRFLIGTKHIGLYYSPASEKSFNDT